MKISNQSLTIIILATALACSGHAQTTKPKQDTAAAPAPGAQNATTPPSGQATATKPATNGASQQDPSAAAQSPAAQNATVQADANKSQSMPARTDSNANQPGAAANAAAAATARQPLLTRSGADVPGLGEGRPAGTISAASKETEKHTARAIAGRTVRGSDGKGIGTIKDLLLDPQSGEVPYAVISSRGFFSRDRLGLVPFKALKPDAGHPNDFTVPLNEDQWEHVSMLAEREFESGHITITDSERREIARRFDQAKAGSAASGSDFYTQGISSYLVRAEEIRGRKVYLGEQGIGTIKDIVLDPTYGTAYALFDPSSRFSNARQNFVVPLNRYSFGATRQEHVTTRLERADFDRMRDVIEPSRAVGPNADAANNGAPRQGVAVQEGANTPVANAKAAAVATGSFGASNSPAPTTQGGGASTQAQNSAPSGKEQAQANGSQPPPVATDAKNGQAAASNSANVSTGQNGSNVAQSSNSAQSGKGQAQANGSQQPPAATDAKNGQGAASNSANASTSQQGGNVAQSNQATKAETAKAEPKASQQSNSPSSQNTGQVAASNSKSTSPEPAAKKSEQALEPTGRVNADPNAPGGESLATARSIRQMLDQESAELARIEVSIDPKSGALVLKGTVADAQLKKSIEDKVTQAAKGAKIDSQIAVEKK